MRIPSNINQNTFTTYDPSPEAVRLLGEVNRKVLSENFQWDQNHCPSLVTLCVRAIKANFEKDPILDELICQDRTYLLEIIDVKLPLELTIPLIDGESYWKRRYHERFGVIIRSEKPETWTWKSLCLEREVQEMIEQAQPEHHDEENMAEVHTLCAPFVKQLVITQLQTWKPPLHWDEEDIPEKYPIDHIDFEPIFQKLVHIEIFDIIYGMSNVGEKFEKRMFKLSITDCQKLGKALLRLKSLRILRIHKSGLEDGHVRALMQNIIKNTTIEEIDLSNCLIGDQGALCIARVLCVHPKLHTLNLCNNKIATEGCEGIGFALLEPECVLRKLNLTLNPLHGGGALGILRAVVRGTNLEDLSMAAGLLDDEETFLVAHMLKINNTLKKLDISNNWFAEEGAEAIVESLIVNRTIEWLDVRETEISQSHQNLIKKYLIRNRLGLENIIEDVIVEEEVIIEETELECAEVEPEEQ